MKITNEVKTGVVVVAAIAVGILFWVKTTDFSASPYKMKTSFNYAEGIKKDSIVKLAGIEVGRVETINLKYTPDTKVELVLVLDEGAKVHEDSVAFIATSGMIGDAYIGITAGSPDKPFLSPGAVIPSEDPIEMRKMMKKADMIADNLDKTLLEVKKLTENVSGVVSDNKAYLGNISANLEQASSNFKEFSEDIKKNPWKLLMKK
jgi:phospholipid/cholesterol/gamma-HCH transport system substrate-binding protein